MGPIGKTVADALQSSDSSSDRRILLRTAACVDK